MSKAVKRVTRSITKVVRGVSKAVTGVVKRIGGAIKKFASSRIGKVLLAAATIYFGGAAIMGAIGGAGASSGFMGTIAGAVKGAGAGITSAWSGLTGAAGAAMGGNFGAAGSSLSQGFMGANAAGAGAVGGVQAVGMNIPAGVQASGAVTTPVGSGGLSPLAQAGGSGAGAGAGAGGASTGFFSDPLVRYAAVTGGTQLAAGALQGYGQQKAMEDEQARQNANMSTRFDFEGASEGDPQFSGGTGTSGGFRPMPGRESPELALINQRGLVGGNMTFGNRNMPVYNPAYAGMPVYRG
jgi:hypothetical protein